MARIKYSRVLYKISDRTYEDASVIKPEVFEPSCVCVERVEIHCWLRSWVMNPCWRMFFNVCGEHEWGLTRLGWRWCVITSSQDLFCQSRFILKGHSLSLSLFISSFSIKVLYCDNCVYSRAFDIKPLTKTNRKQTNIKVVLYLKIFSLFLSVTFSLFLSLLTGRFDLEENIWT